MTLLVAGFLVIALSAYVLFGGADFGAGILETALTDRAQKKKLQDVLAPIWEANHVWLIAVVVILFVGFPRFYSLAMTRLYLPISLALLGILIRGTAFTLRKYDPAAPSWRRFYSALFRLSSLITPFFFGFVVAGLLAKHPGAPLQPPQGNYKELYVDPWFTPFGFSCGVFVCCLFAYLAAVFFYGELASDDDKAELRRRMVAFFAATFLSGGGVLAAGEMSGLVPWPSFGATQAACQLSAALATFWFFRSLRGGDSWSMRFAAGVQVLSILVGWFSTQYPTLLRFESGALTLTAAAAPAVTQLWLLIGLVVVLAAVVPLLVVLYRVFDSSETH